MQSNESVSNSSSRPRRRTNTRSSSSSLDSLAPKILVKKPDIECAICQSNCEVDSYARILLCGHKFCDTCISP